MGRGNDFVHFTPTPRGKEGEKGMLLFTTRPPQGERMGRGNDFVHYTSTPRGMGREVGIILYTIRPPPGVG